MKVVQGTRHWHPGERLTVRSIIQEIEEGGLPVIGYMSLDEQVDKDFSLARRKALLRRIGARLRRDAASAALLCFEEVRKTSGASGGVCRGRRTVPSGQVAGSVGRCSEFDRAFLPARASVGTKWKRIDRAFHRGEELPPVSLYKIGGAYFVLDGNHRVSVVRYHGVEWIDADVTEFRAPSPLVAARAGTVEETKGHMRFEEVTRSEDSKMYETIGSEERQEKIEVRWGLEEDETRIAELMELNGMRKALAFEERFIVADSGGKVLAALRYRTEPKRLLLGLLVSDPWAGERPLAVALYEGAGELARDIGCTEVRARPVVHADDYPHEAGYRWRFSGGWYLDVSRLPRRRRELPPSGWRRMVALLGVPAVPFFRALSGVGPRMDESR